MYPYTLARPTSRCGARVAHLRRGTKSVALTPVGGVKSVEIGWRVTWLKFGGTLTSPSSDMKLYISQYLTSIPFSLTYSSFGKMPFAFRFGFGEYFSFSYTSGTGLVDTGANGPGARPECSPITAHSNLSSSSAEATPRPQGLASIDPRLGSRIGSAGENEELANGELCTPDFDVKRTGIVVTEKILQERVAADWARIEAKLHNVSPLQWQQANSLCNI